MRIGVYGLGRFGFFWASLLQRSGLDVCAYGRHHATAPAGVASVGEDEVLGCDVIFFCVTISAFEQVIKACAPKIRAGALVMDTCSVKIHPKAVMEKYLPAGVHCIATHPMFGPDSGRNGVQGLPIVVCPVSESAGQLAYWEGEFARWGLHVLRMTCDEHDRQAAWSQGVTHFVGRTLDELHLQPTQLATVGYQRLMSIVEQTCNDPLQLFYDLQRYNPYAPQMRQRLKQALEHEMDVLEQQEADMELLHL